jgi:hypothetical protein
MSSKFDLALVVSKATSFASSSCTSDEDAGTGSLLVSFSAPFGGLPRNCSCTDYTNKDILRAKILAGPRKGRCPLLDIADSLSRKVTII